MVNIQPIATEPIGLDNSNPLANISPDDITILGQSLDESNCGSLLDFLKSRSGIDFPDLNKYPITNYRIKYKHKNNKTKGIVMCKRLRKKKADQDDLDAYNKKKNGPRAMFKGRFMCVDGEWDADWHRNGDLWDIPMCPDRDRVGAWSEFAFEEHLGQLNSGQPVEPQDQDKILVFWVCVN